MIKDLIKLSNHLDAKGLRKEADYLDAVIKKIAEVDEEEQGMLDRLHSMFKERNPDSEWKKNDPSFSSNDPISDKEALAAAIKKYIIDGPGGQGEPQPNLTVESIKWREATESEGEEGYYIYHVITNDEEGLLNWTFELLSTDEDGGVKVEGTDFWVSGEWY